MVPAKVFLVGAGPGDPGLLTLRGQQCLGRADVVLYDYLANPRLLDHASPSAEKICLGRHGSSRIWKQDEINQRMVDLALHGRCVVRLKGGDPAMFGRLAEELAALRRHQIPYEIVPGVTAAAAVAGYLEIPITHRDEASSVAFVAGQERAGKREPALDFQALAKFPGTLVFYMGVTSSRVWTQALIDGGMSPDTPAAVVRRCTFPDQQKIVCTLSEVADRLAPERAAVRPPVIIVVGGVAAHAPALSWFEQRPLFGRSILVTRPRHQADQLGDLLASLGAEVLTQPAIDIQPPADWAPVDAAIARLPELDWVVFSSANGVRFFMERLLAAGGDMRQLAPVRLAAIGPGTAAELGEFNLRADLMPDEFRAESLAAALSDGAAGRRFLLVRASRGREVLADQLRAAGGDVEQVVAYQSTDVTQADREILERLRAGRIDCVTVTSSAIARSLATLFGGDLHKTQLASISPVTSATLSELGFEPACEAQEYTMRGLVDALL